MPSMVYADAFFDHYITTALWSSTNEEPRKREGECLDANYSSDDIDPTTLASMRADCDKFIDGLTDELREYIDTDYNTAETAGHDFWLTRNGHGAGFWDGDYPDDIGKALTDASKAFGESYLYVGDDDKIYS